MIMLKTLFLKNTLSLKEAWKIYKRFSSTSGKDVLQSLCGVWIIQTLDLYQQKKIYKKTLCKYMLSCTVYTESD